MRHPGRRGHETHKISKNSFDKILSLTATHNPIGDTERWAHITYSTIKCTCRILCFASKMAAKHCWSVFKPSCCCRGMDSAAMQNAFALDCCCPIGHKTGWRVRVPVVAAIHRGRSGADAPVSAIGLLQPRRIGHIMLRNDYNHPFGGAIFKFLNPFRLVTTFSSPNFRITSFLDISIPCMCTWNVNYVHVSPLFSLIDIEPLF